MRSWMISLVSGIVFVGFWPALPPWPSLLVLVTIALIAGLGASWAATLVAGFALGCGIGVAHGTLLLQSQITSDCVGVPIVVSGTVSSLPRERRMFGGSTLQQRFEFSSTTLTPLACQGPQKLQLSYYGDHKISVGEAWQFEVKLRRAWGLANPGAFNMQSWFANRGIDAVGSVRITKRTFRLGEHVGVLSFTDRLRQKISLHIDALSLSAEGRAILKAITVADSSGVDRPLWRLFQQYGINHLLVISGLHVGMVAAVGYLLGGLCLRLLSPFGYSGTWIPAVLALTLALFYAALAGFSLPVQRALYMLSCFVLAHLIGRKSSAISSLLLAALVVLFLSPLAAVGSGFWLSFGAVTALLWFGHWQRGFGAVRRVVQTQASISLFMLPLGALFFGGGSLVAFFANLVMIPLVGWVVVPLALAAAVCVAIGWNVAETLWWLACWPLDWLLPLARDLASSAGAWLYVPLTASLGLIVLGVLSVGLLILPGRNGVKVLALLLAIPLVLPTKQQPFAPTLVTEVTVLDVGQGTAIVVRSGRRVLLYDTGGGDPEGVNMGSLVVLPYLQQLGVTALDTLVISHADLDHSAGAAEVLTALAVSRYRFGGNRPQMREYRDVGRPCVAGESWRWPGGQVFRFLSPAQAVPKRRNDSSCVLQIQVGEYHILLPGDIEAGRERQLVRFWGDQLSSNWLAAAHHGSKTSTTTTFLKRVQPELVVISSGYANRFGHPHPTVTDRLQQHGATVLSTASAGALTFTIVPGEKPRIQAYRNLVRRYWM